MTNEIRLKGIICNIQPSHTIGEIQYDKADLIVKRIDGREDVLDLRFKKFCNPYKDGQETYVLFQSKSLKGIIKLKYMYLHILTFLNLMRKIRKM